MAHQVPPAAEVEWLIQALGDLVRAQGHQHFLEAPLILATPEHFPDPWTPDHRGVRAMLMRLLRYAGLHEEVRISRFTEARAHVLDHRGEAQQTEHQGTAAWYAGYDGEALCFGVEAEGLKDPESLVGTLSHEVAHAWRDQHDLQLGHGELEERLTDLTTVYLGFGVLTTNASYRYRAGLGEDGSAYSSQWSYSSRGYLSPEAMSLLLAAQVLARGEDPGRIARLLEPNQSACFLEGYDLLVRRPEVFLELGLPKNVAAERTRALKARFRRSARWSFAGAAVSALVGMVAAIALARAHYALWAGIVAIAGAGAPLLLVRRARRAQQVLPEAGDARVAAVLKQLEPRDRTDVN